MAGMDDLFDEQSLSDILDSALADEIPGTQAPATLLEPKGRKELHTPILSGRTMANAARKREVGDSTKSINVDAGPADPARTGTALQDMPLETIFERAGLATDDDSFTVYRLERLLDDDEIAGLDLGSRVAAVRAILKSHGVDLESIRDDAVARRDALESHDARLMQQMARVEAQVKQENASLQAEIEEFANPRLQRMEANEQRLEQLRLDLDHWAERKANEQTRFVDILQPLGGDDRLRVTERVEVRASENSAPYALSGEDVFDDPPGPKDSGPTQMGPAAGSKSLKDDREVENASVRGSVQTELPAEFHAASASQEDYTGEFKFARPALRVPSTPVEGLFAGLSFLIWIIAAVLLTAQLVTEIKTGPAWAIALGGPILFAFLMSTVFRRGSFTTGFFMMLLYASLVSFAAAHYDPENLVQSLQRSPLLFVGEAGLPDSLDASLSQFTHSYATVVSDVFGLVPAPAEAASN